MEDSIGKKFGETDNTREWKPIKEVFRVSETKSGLRRGSNQSKIFSYLKKRRGKGATDAEIRDALSINANSVRHSRLALEDRGLVRFGGNYRLTASNRLACVWVAEVDNSGI